MIYAWYQGVAYPTTEYELLRDEITYKCKIPRGSITTKIIFQTKEEADKFQEEWIGKPLFEQK